MEVKLDDFSYFCGFLFQSLVIILCDIWLFYLHYARRPFVGKQFSKEAVKYRTWLKKRDKQFTKEIFDFVCNHFVLQYFLTLCSYSCDGSVWFTIPIIPIVCQLYKSPEETATFTGWKSFLFRKDFSLFCFMLLCCCTLSAAVELSLKIVVRRKRPSFNNKSTFFVPAEKWSFPSGHTMRAFTICSYLSFRVPWLNSVFPILKNEVASILFTCCLFTVRECF